MVIFVSILWTGIRIKDLSVAPYSGFHPQSRTACPSGLSGLHILILDSDFEVLEACDAQGEDRKAAPFHSVLDSSRHEFGQPLGTPLG